MHTVCDRMYGSFLPKIPYILYIHGMLYGNTLPKALCRLYIDGMYVCMYGFGQPYGLTSTVRSSTAAFQHRSDVTKTDKSIGYRNAKTLEVADGRSVQRVVAQPPLLGKGLSKVSDSRQGYKAYDKLL